ncbi:transposase [Kribbella sp. NPDC051936]|uniref:transposase n=1 Tax=Kribbella sp. NPDC051936 TaxID=3154946 RepID=UPI0034424A91
MHRAKRGEVCQGRWTGALERAGKRPRFSAQFRAEAVQMVVRSSRPITEVAGDLGVKRKTLNKWVSEFAGRCAGVCGAGGSGSGAGDGGRDPPVADGERVLEKPLPGATEPRLRPVSGGGFWGRGSGRCSTGPGRPTGAGRSACPLNREGCACSVGLVAV